MTDSRPLFDITILMEGASVKSGEVPAESAESLREDLEKMLIAQVENSGRVQWFRVASIATGQLTSIPAVHVRGFIIDPSKEE